MKCPNCHSHMFVVGETVNDRSHVTFTRCSICASEHVSSEPILQAGGGHSEDYFGASASNDNQRYFMA